MKKILLSTLCIILLICSVASCQTVKAYDLYQSAWDQLYAAEQSTSYDMDIDMQMKMTMNGETANVSTTGNMKIKSGKSESDMVMQANLNMNTTGVSMDMNMYVVGGYAYMDLMGMKVKQIMPNLDEYTQNSEMVNFQEDAIKDSKVENKNGSKVLTFTIDGAKLTDQLADTVKGLTSGMNSEFSYGDVKLEVTLNSDNSISSYKMVFSCKVDGNSADYVMNLKVNATGDAVIINLPNLDEYSEFSM